MIKKIICSTVAYFLALRWYLRCIPHMTVVAWRQLNGRWYYFRDRPHWFVNDIAELPIEDDDVDDRTRAMVMEARAERQRRIDQGMREIAAISPELAKLLAGMTVQIGGDTDGTPR